jgi:Arylsulfatase A and related enzymes
MNSTHWMNRILTCFIFILNVVFAQVPERPNLVVVYTDEHNFRTIGAYRELLGKSLSELWGDGVVVETPNLDRLAHEGCMFTSFYTVAPLCTPSRASFMTGLYPKATGAWLNNNAMDPNMTTWAEILQQNGYHTGKLWLLTI